VKASSPRRDPLHDLDITSTAELLVSSHVDLGGEGELLGLPAP